jgi:hypothetical protein
MKELINSCLDILKREDVKTELKLCFNPILEIIIYEIKPYIYIILTILFVNFILLLAILIPLLLILRNKQLITKIL